VTGYTSSTDFPTQNPLYPNNAGSRDAFVTSLSPEGDALVYSTYLGGSGGDCGHGIAVDATGNCYVTGETWSTDFPTQHPLYPNNAGRQDVFVTSLSPEGQFLIYSTYLGGRMSDRGHGIAVDATGSCYVTGETWSTDFPTQAIQDPLYPNNAGYRDAFVARLSPAGDALVYSTYLGGSSEDYGNGIAVDNDETGNCYVTGVTKSTDFPRQDPLYPYNAGGLDVFVTSLNSKGQALIYSTYLGGSGNDYGNGIAVDATGSCYVTGVTKSTDFPRQDPLYPYNGGNNDAFVTRLSPAGDALVYSTYLGGSGNDYGNGIAVDATGSCYVTGHTASTDFPTQNPLYPNNAGYCDVFVSKIRSVVLAPVADFSATPTTGTAPLTVNFTDLSTGSITDWAWDFGEGGTSTAKDPSNIYTTPGTYTVSLTVTGPGGTDTKTKIDYITVTAGPLPVPDIKANGLDGPLFITPSESVDISISLDPGDMAGVSADWWGILLSSHGTFPLFGFQAPLFELPETLLFNKPWPTGWYIFLFGLDDVPDGAFELDWYDYVVVVSQPAGAEAEELPDFDAIIKENLRELIRE
jgi:PKD repeat protein